MPKLKLIKTEIDIIPSIEKGQVDYYDTDLHGFAIRVTPESKTFMVYRRIKGHAGKTYIPIGQYGPYSVSQARKLAKDYIYQMDRGINPHPAKQLQVETITLQELFSKYLATKKTLAPATRYQYESWIKNCFQDWQRRDVTDITGSMVLERLDKLEGTKGKGQALNAVKLLKSMFTFGMAVYPDTISRNPVDAVRAVRERNWTDKTRRTTFIKPDDLPAWFKAVSEYSNPKGRDYMLLLLYTGLRRNEAARLKWSDLDFKNKTFTFIPEKKPGDNPEKNRVTMPMSVQLYRLLLKRRAVGYENEYIFPGKHPSPFLSNPDNYKRDIIATTGIQFCFHDLRRTFITVAESLDIPHYSLKALLNHSMGNDVTGGYIQITTERLREPMQKIADKIMELATAEPVMENQEQVAA